MTEEEKKAQENIIEITKHKQINTPSRELNLGIDWVC